MTPHPAGTLSRNYASWLTLLLAIHVVLLMGAAARALNLEHKDHVAEDFLQVTLSAFALVLVAVAVFRRHVRSIAVVGSALTAAILLTPGTVIVVLLCLLSAYVLGVRLVRFLDPRAVTGTSIPWPVLILIGIAVWIGLLCATAAFKIHYAPYYAGVLLIPLAFAWRDTADALIRIKTRVAAPSGTYRPTESVWIAMLMAIVVLHLFIVARPEVGYDAHTMHLQFAMMVNDAHRWRFDVERFAWAVMPLGADWAYTVAYILDGENAARFANLCFGALACALLYALVLRHARRELAIASVCLLASTPLAFAETGTLYVENLWTAFLLGALLVTLEIARGNLSARIGWPVLGLMAAGAMQTKVIGVIWLVPLLAYAFYSSTTRTDPWWPGGRGVLVMSGAVAIGAWPYVNAWLRTGNPVFPYMNAWFRSPLADTATSFSNQVYVKPLHPWSVYDVVTESRHFIEGHDGAAGFHWLLLIPLILVAFARRRPAEQWLCAGLCAVFFVTVFMQQAYLRYLLPAFVLLAVIGAWAANDLPDRPFTRFAILVVGGALCFLQVRLIYTGNWTNARLCVRCAFDSRERDDFLSRYMVDRVVSRYLNQALPEARVGFLMLNGPSPAGYTGYSRALNWHDHRFYYPVAYAETADGIASVASAFGLTHVVFRTAAPGMETPAIREYRETRVKPVWRFQDFVVAEIVPPP